jgi:GT2 family glycosyltransferase
MEFMEEGQTAGASSTASVVIVNTNEGAVLFECLDALDRAGRPGETIVVDNASTDGSPERAERVYPWVRMLRLVGNHGYAGGNNAGARAASGDVLVFLNPDAFVTSGWLQPLLERLRDPRTAAVSPKIYRGKPGATNTLDSAGCDIEFPLGDAPPRGYLEEDRGQFEQPADVAYVAGAAFAIRADAFRSLGGFDEDFWCYCEEMDLCWRARMSGLRCVYEPRSTVYHLGSFTFGPVSARKVYYQTRNRIFSCVQNLRFPNLALFSLAEGITGSAVIMAAGLIPRYHQYAGAYARAWLDAVRMLPRTLSKRRRRQSERTVEDREVLRLHRRVGIFAVLKRYAVMVRSKSNSLFAPRAASAPTETLRT